MTALNNADAVIPKPSFAGIIGNSSDSFVSNVWRGFDFISDMCFSANYGFTVNGYGEQHEISKAFALSTPNSPVSIDRNINIKMSCCCTDGILFYKSIESSGFDKNNSIAVLATKVGANARYLFPAGSKVQFAGSFAGLNYNDGAKYLGYYDGALGVDQDISGDYNKASVLTRRITGLAVQRNGNLLARSIKGKNLIELFDKTSGAKLSDFQVDSPEKLSFSPSGDLWVVSAGQATVYVNSGGSFTKGFTLPNTGVVLALSVSFDGSIIRVASDTYQTILAYNSAGISLPTFSASVNNLQTPEVTKYSFQFRYKAGLALLSSSERYNTPETFIAEQADGSFWVLDGGNARVQHYSASYTYLGQIAYLSDYHLQSIDPADPTRVLANNLEFKVDFTNALKSGDQTVIDNPSWTLKKNWTLPPAYSPMVRLCTLTDSAGVKKVFGQAPDKTTLTGTGPYVTELVELPTTGLPRLTGIRVNTYVRSGYEWILYPEGLRVVELLVPNKTALDGATVTAGNRVAVYERPFLKTFDSNGNPLFGPIVKKISFVPPDSGPIPAGSPLMQNQIPKLANGNYAIFTAPQKPLGYNHLGFIKEGETAYNKITLPNKHVLVPDGLGNYPDNTSGSNYGGLTGVCVLAVDEYALVVYNGQLGTFSGQMFLYDKDGNFLSQFGRAATNTDEFSNLDKAPAGYGNNNLVAGFTRIGDKLFVLLHDEVFHGGIIVYEVELIFPNIPAIPMQNPFNPTAPTDADPGIPENIVTTEKLDPLLLAFLEQYIDNDPPTLADWYKRITENSVTLTEAQALLATTPPNLSTNCFYAITGTRIDDNDETIGTWNATGVVNTIYVHTLNNIGFDVRGLLLESDGTIEAVMVDVAAGTFVVEDYTAKADLVNGRLKEGQEPTAGVGIKWISGIGYTSNTGLDFQLEYSDSAIKDKRVDPKTGILEDAPGWNTYNASVPYNTLLLAPQLELYYACYTTIAPNRYLGPWVAQSGATRRSAAPVGVGTDCVLLVSIPATDVNKLFVMPYGVSPATAGFRLLYNPAKNEYALDDQPLVETSRTASRRINPATGALITDSAYTTITFSGVKSGMPYLSQKVAIQYGVYLVNSVFNGPWYADATGTAAASFTSTAPTSTSTITFRASFLTADLPNVHIGVLPGTVRELLDLTPDLMNAVMALTYTNCDADPAASPLGSAVGQAFDAIDPDGKNRHYYCSHPTYIVGQSSANAAVVAWHRFVKSDA
jgi:hypothetical protein